MVTLKQINKEIQKEHAAIELVRGSGYFYLVGNDDDARRLLNELNSTSIPCYTLNQMTLERWVADCKSIIQDAETKRNKYK